jgi:hypothetical protein
MACVLLEVHEFWPTIGAEPKSLALGPLGEALVAALRPQLRTFKTVTFVAHSLVSRARYPRPTDKHACLLAQLTYTRPPTSAALLRGRGYSTRCCTRWGSSNRPVSRAFPSWKRSILTEIYLCHACSCHEIEDGNARAGDGALLRKLTRVVLISPVANTPWLSSQTEPLALTHVPCELISVRRPLRPFVAAVLAEIYLCNVCSRQEILRRNGRGQGDCDRLVRQWWVEAATRPWFPKLQPMKLLEVRRRRSPTHPSTRDP